MTHELPPSVTSLAPVSAVLSPVDQLGEDIAVLVSRLHAATYELLVLLQRFDAAGGWGNGFLSCAHWLHWRTGIDLGAAREKVRVARDGRCRFPGCIARRCDAHHVVHWAEGGTTSLDNLVLLCRRHHRWLHEGAYTIRTRAERTAAWLAPLPAGTDGRPVTAAVWDGTRFDLHWVINVLPGHEPLH